MKSTFNLTVPDFPGAYFKSAETVEIYRPVLEMYERAVADYEAGGSAADFEDALTDLGYTGSEIYNHIRAPGWRMPQRYA